MGRPVIALLGGGLFGAGLALSGIANPVMINNFLDLASPDLDFTLIVLFGAALVTSTLAYQLILRVRASPLLGERFELPTRTEIDRRLLVGAVLFGLGWSLSGFCVGPALAGLTITWPMALPYLAAVAVGSFLCDVRSRPS